MKRKIILLKFLFSILLICGNNSNIIAKTYLKTVAKVSFDPRPPTNFTVNRVTDKYNSITFNWTDSPDAVYYRIYWQRKTLGTAVPFVTSTGYTNSRMVGAPRIILTDADLVLPMNYYLYVVAIDNMGNSSIPSNIVVYDTPPDSPKNLTVTQISTTSVKLDWIASPVTDDVIGYFVYDNNYMTAFNSGVTSNSVTLTDLVPNSTHSFAVEAFDSYFNSSFTSPVTKAHCYTADNIEFWYDQSYITKLTIGTNSNTATYNGNNYRNFENDWSLDAYEIYKNSIKNVIEITVAPTPDFDNTTIVSAYIDYNYDGIYDISEKINFGTKGRTKFPVPLTFISDPFVTPAGALTGDTSIRVTTRRNQDYNDTYNDPCRITYMGYTADYMMYIGAGWNRSSSPAPTAPSNKITLTLEGGKNLESISNDAVIKLYPNPVSGDYINITAVADKTPYKIINLLGQDVAIGIVDNGVITIAKLTPGIYSLEFENNNERVVKRFIKQ